MHHRAQLFLIERMIGIVPHLTRARQERDGAAGRTRASYELWWAKGLIFENCMCTLVCPGHMHFTQFCTHERCKGYWALRFDDGAFGAVSLRGLRAFIVFDSPQRMFDGGWTQRLIIDPVANTDQRIALETILLGRAGGPWEKLHSFVATDLQIEYRAIEMGDEGATKRATIADRLKAVGLTNPRPRQDQAGDVRELLQPDPRLVAGDRPRRYRIPGRGDRHQHHANSRPVLELRLEGRIDPLLPGHGRHVDCNDDA